MGIRNLNRYLRNNCPNSIHHLHLSELSGKRIAVDISIYLYKYETENALIENMYNMISIFKYYNIIPIFIFDGKPPPEKKDLLIKRKINRIESQEAYNKLMLKLDDNNDDDKQDIIDALEKLKRQIVQIDKTKIEKIKDLIRAYGETYYDAPGEADELCASLVIKKKVWACLSEDMDLFVYGCKRVLRYFSIIGHNVVLYNMKCILMELDMTQKEFKEVCILSGTDYNVKSNTSTSSEQSNILITMNYFKKYKTEKSELCFYDWVNKHTNYISNVESLNKIYKLFDLTTEHTLLEKFKNIRIESGPVIQKEIEKIMKEDDFIFI